MEKRPENAGREGRARSSGGSRPRTAETGRASRRRAATGTRKKGWRPSGWTVFYLIAGGAALLSMIVMIFAEGGWYTFFYVLLWGLVGILLAGRGIQVFRRQTAPFAKFAAAALFGLTGIALLLIPLLPPKANALLLFLAILPSAALLIAAGVGQIRDPGRFHFTRFESILPVLLLLCAMIFLLRLTFLGGQNLWIPVVIGGLVLSAAAVCVLLILADRLPIEDLASTGERVGCCLLAVMGSFLFVFAAVGVFNYALDKEDPTPLTVEITDKSISGGGRAPTLYLLTVALDDGEQDVPVPKELWNEKEIGGCLTVQLYPGALGYAYCVWEGEPSSASSLSLHQNSGGHALPHQNPEGPHQIREARFSPSISGRADSPSSKSAFFPGKTRFF